MDSAESGCSWAAERSWHAPLSLGLRRLRLRRRQGQWWMGCRPCLLSSFDRAAVICYRATVASINFWHMHTCILSTVDLPLLHIPSQSFWLQGKRKRQSGAKYFNAFTNRSRLNRTLLTSERQPSLSSKSEANLFPQSLSLFEFWVFQSPFLWLIWSKIGFHLFSSKMLSN